VQMTGRCCCAAVLLFAYIAVFFAANLFLC